MKRGRIISSVLLCGFVFITILTNGCTESETDGPGVNEVWLENLAFDPATKTITAGTMITWTNKDNNIHTVTSGTRGNPDGLFVSGDLNLNGTFSYTFDSVGTFTYFCVYHVGMDGSIIVQ